MTDTRTHIDEVREVQIHAAPATAIYVTRDTADIIMEDVADQADRAFTQLTEAFSVLDLTNVDTIKDARFAAELLRQQLHTLVFLAPQDEDDEVVR